jgi:hypothetical protein
MMARGAGNYTSEIKSAMQPSNKPDTAAEKKREGDTPAEMARDKKRGIVEGSARDEQLDAQQMQRAQPTVQPLQHGGLPPHHVAAAAGIAHAILNGGRSGGGY